MCFKFRIGFFFLNFISDFEKILTKNRIWIFPHLLVSTWSHTRWPATDWARVRKTQKDNFRHWDIRNRCFGEPCVFEDDFPFFFYQHLQGLLLNSERKKIKPLKHQRPDKVFFEKDSKDTIRNTHWDKTECGCMGCLIFFVLFNFYLESLKGSSQRPLIPLPVLSGLFVCTRQVRASDSR